MENTNNMLPQFFDVEMVIDYSGSSEINLVNSTIILPVPPKKMVLGLNIDLGYLSVSPFKRISSKRVEKMTCAGLDSILRFEPVISHQFCSIFDYSYSASFGFDMGIIGTSQIPVSNVLELLRRYRAVVNDPRDMIKFLFEYYLGGDYEEKI